MHHRRLREAAAFLVLLPTATGADIISPDFCAALPKRRVEQTPVTHAELRMQPIEQSDEILGECLWGKFIEPEEAPCTFSLQHFGEPVKSVPPLAGVGHDVCYSEPGLQGVALYLQRPAVTFCGSPAAPIVFAVKERAAAVKGVTFECDVARVAKTYKSDRPWQKD